MPPLGTLDKTLVAIALSQFAIGTNAATISVSDTCSLANAIRSANQSSSIGGCTAGIGGDNEIELPATNTITLAATESDGALAGSDGGLPLITSTITLQGNGATVERNNAAATPAFRLFGMTGNSATLTLNSITLQNGLAQQGSGNGGYGGAIYVTQGASLFINSSNIVGNESRGYGGAIYSYGSGQIEINGSNISGNSAQYKGGAFSGNFQGSGMTAGLTISNSLISNNHAVANQGGGISLYRGAANLISNSTVSNNRATGGGALYLNAVEIEIINSTISDNTNSGFGGGLSVAGNMNFPPALTLSNTVIANSSNGEDCTANYAPTVTATTSWVESFDGSCVVGGGVAAGITEGDPGLGSLSNNGGFTKTHAPLPDSGLLEAGTGSICSAAPINGIDQIGDARGSTNCTIGAVEEAVSPNSFFVVPVPGKKSVIFSL